MDNGTPDRMSVGRTVQWQPKVVQFNNGRIELTLPYGICVGIGLVGLVVVLLAFRLGQAHAPSRVDAQQVKADPAPRRQQPAAGSNERPQRPQPPAPGAQSPSGQPGPGPQQTPVPATQVVQPGNAVVVQEYTTVADLKPVADYFDGKGIATEILRSGNRYFLVTRERFQDNPNNEGTRGYTVKQRIVTLGKDYQAPQGAESFAPNLFKDAYGRKIDEQFIGVLPNVH